jgi:hypothetical protein
MGWRPGVLAGATRDLQADFRLDDLGAIEFKEFGEETNDFIRAHCYPELEAVLSSDAVTSLSGDYSTTKKKVIKKAVARERTRFWKNQPDGPRQRRRSGNVFRKRWERPALWRTTTWSWRPNGFWNRTRVKTESRIKRRRFGDFCLRFSPRRDRGSVCSRPPL